jgi:uncharacterized membrane protein
MEQPISRSPGSNLPWPVRREGRIGAAIVAMAVAYLATRGLPDEVNLLIPYNIGVGVYLVLTGALMRRASPEDAAELSRRGEPNNTLALIVVIALYVVSLVGVAAMLNHPGRPAALGRQSPHDDVASRGHPLLAPGSHLFRSSLRTSLLRRHRRRRKLTYHRGLEFPQRETADYWDFMYYSTLVHAIFSFLFVTAIIGFFVNVISNVT